MADTIPTCPCCSATQVVRNGATHPGKPSFRCRACGRRFVADPATKPVSDERKELVRRLLSERLGLRADRPGDRPVPELAAGVRQRPAPGGNPGGVGAAEKESGELIVEADELWSYVGNKRDRWWVWVALDADPR